jgi:cytoskeletal protein CcmA (bactofilin family)
VAAFSDLAFDTDAFDSDAFDFDAVVVEPGGSVCGVVTLSVAVVSGSVAASLVVSGSVTVEVCGEH